MINDSQYSNAICQCSGCQRGCSRGYHSCSIEYIQGAIHIINFHIKEISARKNIKISRGSRIGADKSPGSGINVIPVR